MDLATLTTITTNFVVAIKHLAFAMSHFRPLGVSNKKLAQLHAEVATDEEECADVVGGFRCRCEKSTNYHYLSY